MKALLSFIFAFSALILPCTASGSVKADKAEAFPVTLLSKNKNADGSVTLKVEPSGVCSREIEIKAKNGVILEVYFYGGCPGNTQGVARLVKGMTVKKAIETLEGIDCGGRGTSCPDQLTKALKLLL